MTDFTSDGPWYVDVGMQVEEWRLIIRLGEWAVHERVSTWMLTLVLGAQ